MYNKIKISLLAIIAASSLLASSCSKEDYNLEDLSSDGLNIHTSLAAPICSSRSTFADIFDMSSINGYLRPVDGSPINLAEASLGEIQAMLGDKPMPLLNTTKFNSAFVMDDVDFSDVFGDGNSVTGLDSLVLIIDVETNVPFEIKYTIDFVTGSNPTIDSPAIEGLRSEIVIPACVDGQSKVNSSQYIRYGNICSDLSRATGLSMSLSFAIPADRASAAISLDQYVDLKLKAYVEGDINPSEF